MSLNESEVIAVLEEAAEEGTLDLNNWEEGFLVSMIDMREKELLHRLTDNQANKLQELYDRI